MNILNFKNIKSENMAALYITGIGYVLISIIGYMNANIYNLNTNFKMAFLFQFFIGVMLIGTYTRLNRNQKQNYSHNMNEKESRAWGFVSSMAVAVGMIIFQCSFNSSDNSLIILSTVFGTMVLTASIPLCAASLYNIIRLEKQYI